MIVNAKNPYENQSNWVEISQKEKINEANQPYVRIKYQTHPDFKRNMTWRIARLAAASLLMTLTGIPATGHTKEIDKLLKKTAQLFREGLTGIEEVAVCVAKDASSTKPLSLRKTITSADSTVHAIPEAALTPYETPTLQFTPTDFSQISSLLANDSDDAGRSQTDFSSKLLECLQENETLRQLYSKDAGVSEGYTILEHTKLVLETAAKWRGSFESKVLPLATWKEFLLFLALHDIGKGVAKENESAIFGTSITAKENELKNTQAILQQVMKHVGIDENKITLFSTLLTYDSQGLYLRSLISKKEALDNITEMAFIAKVPLKQMYDLLEVFHAVDAASYPILFSSIFQQVGTLLVHSKENQKLVDSMRAEIELAEEGKEALQELANKVRTSSEDRENFGVLLAQDAKKLFVYLRVVHREMLLDDSVNGNKDLYQRIKKDFRDILLAIAKQSGQETFNEYLKSIHKEGARTDTTVQQLGGSPFFTLFFPKVDSTINLDSISFNNMIDELVTFRKDYLIRYSRDKVERFIVEEKKNLETTVSSDPYEAEIMTHLRSILGSIRTDNQDSLNLLPLTFLHGSNSAILPNLLLTDMQLIPTGRLFKMGIVPLSGELQIGTTVGAVNCDKISGTSLDRGERAISYALEKGFHTSVETEKEKVEQFISSMNERRSEKLYKSHSDILSADLNMRLSVSILRLRTLDQEAFNMLEPTLRVIVDKMETDFNEYKKSTNYKDRMPKKEDPTGTLGYGWHDTYWKEKFDKLEGAIKSLKRAIIEPLVVPQSVKVAINHIFPMTFGSKTLNPLFPLAGPSERCSIKAARLGKDLQYIFAESNDRDAIQIYLKEQRLENDIQVVEKRHLEEAILLNRIAAPYFCDIASRKKMEKMAEESGSFHL